ncbi:beta-galactosidase [Streptomyces sp. NBC_01808]|uniref:beta-galactosidase n=1 Tax=Streptomyces sp. NBC_01808 TaxID=2975947 RepID=UPI002DD9A349|nr:beta-galactosidase [Streptomyces sp. NBC_01808]WSA35981.1 beta-galactosidase [Streptomyces sp. NBC_01808]
MPTRSDASANTRPAVRLGAAYYREYQPYERLEADLDLMARTGLTLIRVGESVWSTWEPEDGVFDLDWLRPVLDGAHERGIAVLLGTPTYAVPPWLQRKHPELAVRLRSGRRVPWGARQEADFTSPVFRRHAERVVRRVVGRYAGHPAVAGYQVDNEPGLHLMHNPEVFAGFVARLKECYGSVDVLNERWGLTYWSHRIGSWEELWPPEGNTTPSYDLAWRRYQADLTTEFIAWQAGLVRELARPGQYVTTCVAYTRPAVDDVSLNGALDVASANVYYATQDELALPDAGRRHDGGWFGQGVWQLYQAADRARGSRQAPFHVTETGATTIGGAHQNHPPYAGQLRQAAWALVARGAREVAYWHWHTLHFGHETYWGGLLGHSLRPGRILAEAARIARELAAADGALDGLVPDADVTLLRSVESDWAFQHQPPLAFTGTYEPDPRSYTRITGAFYKGFFDAGRQVDVLSVPQLPGTAEELARERPVLVAPALYATGDTTLALLDGYARAGGHLMLTFRSGYADEEARARAEVAPGPLRAAAGVHYAEYSSLREPVPVRAAGPGGTTRRTGFRLPPGARATAWADGLVPAGAEPLAWYEHPHFGRWPAATTHRYGAGRVTYVGTLPDSAFAAALAEFTGPGVRQRWRDLPESVTVTSARNGAGERLWFVHNWSWEPVRAVAPEAVTDVLAGDTAQGVEEIRLGAWDVRVLRSAGGPPAASPGRPGTAFDTAV